ncbi:sigma-54 interaction domain-containing protein [Salinimonas chungwhensis]|uniref:sigma-54 interaction domain-containing protein n=1 Tax=Salinimonas chungwhensis TaxID=265425 RepID=UPI000368D070|nr:sigma 54-interacting transcriptional regulator [Salinimonas chungwhensis]
MNSLNKKLLQVVLDAIPDGIHIASNKGRTLSVNKAYESLTGLKREKVTGVHVEELVNDGLWQEVLREGKTVTHAYSLGENQTIVVSANPMFDEKGKLEYIVSSVRNVTSLVKYNQRQKQQQNPVVVNSKNGRKTTCFDEKTEFFAGEKTCKCYSLAKRVAPTDAKILIQGETGTGKTVLAQYIHDNSLRSDQAFLSLNCAAMPEGLIEAELFGYAKGAFTGASSKGKPGLLDIVNGGTLFLDEIGDLPLSLQVKLLKVLEESQFLPLGATQFRKTNFRLITATHHDLSEAVKGGTFREDLFYRIQTIPLELPALKDRKDEIVPLLNYYIKHFAKQYGMQKCLDPDTAAVLLKYRWPGNIRELINLTEQLVLITEQKEIRATDLPSSILAVKPTNDAIDFVGNLNQQVAKLEQKMIAHAIKMYGSTRAAAASLGINQSTLVKKRIRYKSLV